LHLLRWNSLWTPEMALHDFFAQNELLIDDPKPARQITGHVQNKNGILLGPFLIKMIEVRVQQDINRTVVEGTDGGGTGVIVQNAHLPEKIRGIQLGQDDLIPEAESVHHLHLSPGHDVEGMAFIAFLKNDISAMQFYGLGQSAKEFQSRRLKPGEKRDLLECFELNRESSLRQKTS